MTSCGPYGQHRIPEGTGVRSCSCGLVTHVPARQVSRTGHPTPGGPTS